MPPGIANLYTADWPRLAITPGSTAQASQAPGTIVKPSWPPQRIKKSTPFCGPAAPPRQPAQQGAPNILVHPQRRSATRDIALGIADDDTAFDAPLARQAAHTAWRDIPISEEEAFMQLHIADRFKAAFELVDRAPQRRLYTLITVSFPGQGCRALERLQPT
jgi:hypothetical protein